METLIIVGFRYNAAKEYKTDFYSFGKPLRAKIFNHKGLESVRYNNDDTYLFKFSNYSDAMLFMQYVDSIGINVHM